jgi:hypothetical protein
MAGETPGAAPRAAAGGAIGGQITLVNMIPKALSGEAWQDSEPSIAVNPNDPTRIVGTAFTPDPFGGDAAPVYVSEDGGLSWVLRSTVPSEKQTQDISGDFGGASGNYYAGLLKLPGDLLLSVVRAADVASNTVMTEAGRRSKVDQPFVRAVTVGGRDRVYVGFNDLGAASRRTASVFLSLDGAAPTPKFRALQLEKRATGSAGQDGPQVRPAVHRDGVVYVAFYGWRAFDRASNRVTADVVVMRDDAGGGAATPFTALTDPTDGVAGRIVAAGVKFTWNAQMGQQRLGGDIAISVNPKDKDEVYLAWADVQPAGYTLHLRRSADGGRTWSANDLRTIALATNPALAVNAQGVACFLYQRVVGTGAGEHWRTVIERSVGGANWATSVRADVPASSPAPQFQPYIGDYVGLTSVGDNFFGVFSAANTPDTAHFPNGVRYQRNADFSKRRLLDVDGVSAVRPSIDPFFFKVTS